MSLTQFAGTVYPDNSFSLGAVPRERKAKIDTHYDRQYASQLDSYSTRVSKYGINYYINIPFWRSPKMIPPLFIVTPKSSPDSHKVYGKHGITRRGRKTVKCASLLLEEKYGKERLGFVTCTLPAFGRIIQRTLISRWGCVVRRFFQKIRRQLKKLRKPLYYVSVTEIQERRFAKTGIPVPHLHFVYVCKDSRYKPYWLYICQIHRAFNVAIAEVLRDIGKNTEIDVEDALTLTGSVHAARVQRSSAAYLGKYMSKGSKVLKSMTDAGYVEFPRQWWSTDMYTRKLYKKSLKPLSSNACKLLFYDIDSYCLRNIVIWHSYVDVKISGVVRCIGLVGTLSLHGYLEVLNFE
jgi:hypothetical protein